MIIRYLEGKAGIDHTQVYVWVLLVTEKSYRLSPGSHREPEAKLRVSVSRRSCYLDILGCL